MIWPTCCWTKVTPFPTESSSGPEGDVLHIPSHFARDAMACSEDAVPRQIRARAPYRSLCCELLIQLARDQQRGWPLTECDWRGARRFARYIDLPGLPALLRRNPSPR